MVPVGVAIVAIGIGAALVAQWAVQNHRLQGSQFSLTCLSLYAAATVVVDRRHARAGFDDAPTIERHRRGVRDRVFCIYVRYELAARGSADSLR